MAKNWVTQDVYNAMKGLASDKNEYEYNDSIGNTAERDKYGNQATAKYEVINAYSPDLRATLKNSNAQQTRNLLKNYGVARDANTLYDEIVANKFGYEKAKANHGDYKQYETAASALYDELSAVDPATATMLRNLSYQEALDWKNQKTPTNATENFSDTSKTMKGYGDNIYGDVRTMYFDENYGKGVRDNFNAYGNAKAGQAAANAASENGGNFDSFSEYNKNATDLSYKVAGENAVQRMREGYSGWANDFLGTMGNTLNTNAKNWADYDYENKSLETTERMNTDDNLTKQYQYTTESNANKYVADANVLAAQINADVQKHGHLSEQIIAQIEADAKKYGFDASKTIAEINKTINSNGSVTGEELIGIEIDESVSDGSLVGWAKDIVNSGISGIRGFWDGLKE